MRHCANRFLNVISAFQSHESPAFCEFCPIIDTQLVCSLCELGQLLDSSLLFCPQSASQSDTLPCNTSSELKLYCDGYTGCFLLAGLCFCCPLCLEYGATILSRYFRLSFSVHPQAATLFSAAQLMPSSSTLSCRLHSKWHQSCPFPVSLTRCRLKRPSPLVLAAASSFLEHHLPPDRCS